MQDWCSRENESRNTEGSTYDITLRDTTLKQRKGWTFLLRMRQNRKVEGKEADRNIIKIMGGGHLKDGRVTTVLIKQYVHFLKQISIYDASFGTQ